MLLSKMTRFAIMTHMKYVSPIDLDVCFLLVSHCDKGFFFCMIFFHNDYCFSSLPFLIITLLCYPLLNEVSTPPHSSYSIPSGLCVRNSHKLYQCCTCQSKNRGGTQEQIYNHYFQQVLQVSMNQRKFCPIFLL